MTDTAPLPDAPIPDRGAFQQAEALHRQGNLDEAAQFYRIALATAPGDIQALHGLGAVLAQQRAFAAAADVLSKALALRPDDAALAGTLQAALTNWGNALLQNGDALGAIALYDRALVLAPRRSLTHFNKATALQALGRHAEAIAHFNQALEIQPDFAEAWANFGVSAHQLGRFGDAVQAFVQALTVNPDFIDAGINLGLAQSAAGAKADAGATAQALLDHPRNCSYSPYNFGLLLAQCGRTTEARTQLELALAQDPDDAQGARLILASLGLAEAPKRASDAQIDQIYRARAQSWDQGARSATPYRGHIEVAQAAQRLGVKCSVLDAGCGTGLVGDLLRPWGVLNLDGIDLSAAMLAQAQAKGCYDTLVQGDMVAFMESHPDSYALVTSAATLIHFGDLSPPFKAAAMCLRPKGWFVFTLFPGDPAAQLAGLAEGGCYQHSPDYVRATAQDSGFSVEEMIDIIHEYRFGQPVPALLVTLKRLQ